MKLNTTRNAFLKPLALALLLCCGATQARAQYVRHLRGPLERPTDVKRGDKIPVGQVISTGSKGRVILQYSLPPVGGSPGYGFAIINRNQTYTVPERIVEYARGEHILPVGSATDLQKTTGIGIVILYGPPGAGLGSDARLAWIRPDSGEALKEFEEALKQMPDTLNGTLSSAERNSFKIQREGKNYDFQLTPNTKIAGTSALHELINKEVWVEYLTKPYFAYTPDRKYRTDPYTVEETVLLMPTQSPDFYRYLGFEEKESYRGSCPSSPSDHACVDFEDGYVWLVQDSINGWSDIDERYGLKIRKAIGGKAEYHHIIGTAFVKKTDKTQRD